MVRNRAQEDRAYFSTTLTKTKRDNLRVKTAKKLGAFFDLVNVTYNSSVRTYIRWFFVRLSGWK